MTDHERLREVLTAYEVGEEIGRGAYGVVIGAQHRSLERRVAIKQLPVAVSADEEARERLRAEARVVASLDHPHIVRVYDFIEREHVALFVMEFMPGGTLYERFSEGSMTPAGACAVSFATLSALAHAHEQGVLHRDVKPENVLFNAEGVPKLADFGIAKQLAGGGTRTATGMIMGTPAYMAPEQASGDEVGPATDVYAVGAMLYELLSGRLPFESTGDPLSQIYRHVNEAPPELREVDPSVPAPVAGVVMRALAKEPSERPDSAAGFATLLDRAAVRAFGRHWIADADMTVLTTRRMLRPQDAPDPSRPPTPDASQIPAPPQSSGQSSSRSAAPSASSPGPPAPAPSSGTSPRTSPQPSARSSQAGEAPTPQSQGSGARARGAPSPSRPSRRPQSRQEPAPSTRGSDRRGRRAPLWIGLAVLVVAAVAGGVVVLLPGGGESTDQASPSPSTEVEVPPAAITRFRDACDANGVSEELCTCALDASLEELTPDEFLANDRLLQETGDQITAPVQGIFDECLDRRRGDSTESAT